MPFAFVLMAQFFCQQVNKFKYSFSDWFFSFCLSDTCEFCDSFIFSKQTMAAIALIPSCN